MLTMRFKATRAMIESGLRLYLAARCEDGHPNGLEIDGGIEFTGAGNGTVTALKLETLTAEMHVKAIPSPEKKARKPRAGKVS